MTPGIIVRSLVGVGVVELAVAVLGLGGYDDPQGNSVARVGLALQTAGLLGWMAMLWQHHRASRR